MKKNRVVRNLLPVAFAAMLLFVPSVRTYAQTPSSPNYQVPESSFSTGGDVDASSSGFRANASVGELGVGIADSFSYSAQAGLITPNEEFLELVVQTSSVDLGTLLSTTTAIGSGDFYVRTYINGNYVVQTMSPTMTSEAGSTIDPVVTAAIPATNTNQFGINLVENTCPASVSIDTPCVGTFGTNPAPAPSTQFANGEAATGYDTDGFYQYNQNDVIAQSGSVGEAWGRTNFSVSYMVNVNSTLPAGQYEMNHDLVLISTF